MNKRTDNRLDRAISIIIPAYQAGKTINRAIQSALDLSGLLSEVIVVDDGSTDNTAELVADMCKKDNRVILITQENSGRSCARNAALRRASGKWIMFLDSDDQLLPNSYNVIRSALNLYADMDMIVFGYVPSLRFVCDQAKGDVLSVIDNESGLSPSLLSFEELAAKMIEEVKNEHSESMFELSSVWARLYSRSSLETVLIRSITGFKPFPEKLRFSEDRLLNLAVLRSSPDRMCAFFPKYIYCWDLAESNTYMNVRSSDAKSVLRYFGCLQRMQNAGILTRDESSLVLSKEVLSQLRRSVCCDGPELNQVKSVWDCLSKNKALMQNLCESIFVCREFSLIWRLLMWSVQMHRFKAAFSIVRYISCVHRIKVPHI